MNTAKLWSGTRIVAVIAVLFLALPVIALLLRLQWSDLGTVLRSPATLTAAGISLASSLLAALCCVVLGTSLALWLATLSGARATLVRLCVVIPLVMPPVVGGVALMAVFASNGLLGAPLSFLGVSLPKTFAAVILAQIFVALPFMVITVEAALRSGHRDFARIGYDLGASPRLVFWRITLPLLRPALIAGALLCMARALGEYGATTLFAGSVEGTTQTLTQVVMSNFQGTISESGVGYALAGLLLLIAMVVVFLAGLWREPSAQRSGVPRGI